MSREPNPYNTAAALVFLAGIILLCLVAALHGGIVYFTR